MRDLIVIDPATISDRENYKLLVGSVAPRPIALVASLSINGVINVAPFSYFNVVSSQPPMLSVSVGRKQGNMKDTARNIKDTGEFVVHIVDETNVHAANLAAQSLPPDVSEVEVAGFTPVASEAISVPGIREAKVRMECVLEQIIRLGETEGDPTCDLIIGRVVRFHIDEDIYEQGNIRSDKLKPVGRMGGSQYTTLGKTFILERPQ